jgi:hypothetical protein
VSHVSQLVLDELASELPTDAAAKAHVDSCADCRAKLELITAARARTKESVGYPRTLARISSAAEAPPAWRSWLAVLAPALAAGALFFVAIHTGQQEGERLKGLATLDFVRRDGAVVTEVRPGTRLKIKLGAGGHRHALVLSVDDKGAVEQLWPEVLASTALPGSGVVTLPRELEATPGSVRVYARVGNEPIDVPRTILELEDAVKANKGPVLETPPPVGWGAQAVTKRLDVLP